MKKEEVLVRNYQQSLIDKLRAYDLEISNLQAKRELLSDVIKDLTGLVEDVNKAEK